MVLNQGFSHYVTHENSNSTLKSKIGQWHLIAFFSQKMILAKTFYKTYNQKLLAIIEALKNWRHYLKSYKYVLIN